MTEKILLKNKKSKRTEILKPTLSFWLISFLIFPLVAGVLFFVSLEKAEAGTYTQTFNSVSEDGYMMNQLASYSATHDASTGYRNQTD